MKGHTDKEQDAALDGVTIRRTNGSDGGALDRLAGRDSQRLPSDDFLVAEVGGEPWAAVGIHSGAVVADPFRPSADLVELLQLRAVRLRGVGGPGSRPRLRRLLAAGSGRSAT
jgi:hypothetical protein